MLDFDKLWLKRLRVLLENIASDEEQHREIARTAQHIQADYHGRFLVELIQNAADQATAAGLTDARLLIVHRNGLLAVANAGAAFSDKGINALTSLGLSPKKPDEAIGNKGVGFKAVFEVTSAPELYGAARPGRDLADGVPRVRFRICADPFSAPGALARAEALIADILAAEPSIRARLAERFGEVLPPTAFLPHLQAAPPFKFPLVLDAETWSGRLDQLRLSPEDLAGLESMVLLPINEEKHADIETAFVDLTADTGALALFLPGVGHIDVLREDGRIEIRRAERARERLGDGWFSHRETSVTTPEGRAAREWWFAERMLGDAPDESERVRAAVVDLPGGGWSEVDRVPIAVALPKPDAVTLDIPLDGKYVIGLPTLDATGLAWWVNGHFHGTISRKAIDLDSNPLNQLILTASAALMWRALERLKREPFRPENPALEHFAVALSLKGKSQHLWDAFSNQQDPFDAEVVLAPTGAHFVRPNDLRLPDPKDRGLVLLASPDLKDGRLAKVDIVMPHPRLMECEGETFLDITLTCLAATVFLAPVEGDRSLLECWAREHRTDGVDFWRPFLTWCAARVAGDVRDHAIVPVLGGGLAAPEEGVFLPLNEADAHVPPASDIDGLAADALRFADPAALFATADEANTLAFRKVLTACTPPLAAEPHYLALLQDALAPALAAAVAREDRDAADSLFALAVRWVGKVATASDARILALAWRVPNAEGSWAAATVCYTGDGWVRGPDRAAEVVIGAVYEARRILPEWRAFRARFGFRDEDRDSARAVMARLGVASKPRVMRLPAAIPTFNVAYQGPSEPIAGCPWPGTADAWATWLSWVRQYGGFNWRKNTTWSAVDATWLDGLEIPEAADILGAWVLSHPDGYTDATKATFRPEGVNVSQTVISPWVYQLRLKNPRIVPTTTACAARGSLARPLDACVVPAELRRRAGMGLLPIVAEGVNEVLRTELAVVSFPNPPAWWVIRTLKALAAERGIKDSRGLEALVSRLWGRLNNALAQGTSPALEDPLFAAQVPVWRGKGLVMVALADVPVIYVDDDPFNARFLSGFDKELALRPSRAETTWAHLTGMLARRLGADRVRRTSEIEPNVSFEADYPDVSLVEWLEKKTGLGGRLRVDIASLLSRCGRTSLADTRAEPSFRRFLAARVQFGLLTTEVDVPSHWRRGAGQLVVSRDLIAQPFRVFAESWPVVGEDWREAWSSFAHALSAGRDGVERFFWERRIDEATRDEVRIEFGLDADRLRWLQPTLFALWAARQDEPKKTEFDRQLADLRAEDWAEWLGVEHIRALVTAEDGERKPDEYVPTCGVSWKDWHHARRVLGMGPFSFPHVREAFLLGVSHLAACALSVVAGSGPGTPADVSRIRALSVPAGLALEPVDDVGLWGAWLDSLRVLELPEALFEQLDAVAGAGRAIASRVPEAVSPETVAEYREYDEGNRARRAADLRAAFDHVLTALHTHRGAEKVEGAIWVESPVGAALTAPYANRVLLRGRIEAALAVSAPRAHAALLSAGMFGAGKFGFELRAFADGLPPRVALAPPTPMSPAPPPQKIAGVSVRDLANGGLAPDATGALLGAMAASARTADSMTTFIAASAQRQAVPPRPPALGGGSGGGGGGGGRSSWRAGEENEQGKRATGFGGELFVLQQFKVFPGFDEECWKSSSRSLAGLADTGDDSLGYDFLYVDAAGVVGQRAGARCLIEVKASKEAGDATFPMSRNEWKVAGAAHRSDTDVYVIIRVHNVASAPAVIDVLIDPFGMSARGELELADKDLWVSVAAKRGQPPPTEAT